MTKAERIERNEKILRGEKPGPTHFQMWWNRNEKHFARPAAGLVVLAVIAGIVAIVAGIVWGCLHYPYIALWTLPPLAIIGLSYGIGASMGAARFRR